MSAEDIQEAKKKGLRNGATVERRYKKKRCEPLNMRQPGMLWTYHLFQEFDYPFPLSNRLTMTKAVNDESQLKTQGIIKQKGALIYGTQDVYEFALTLTRHPQFPEQSKLDLFVWSDPGGIIAGWMVEEATKYIAPKYIEIMEQEAQKRARGQSGIEQHPPS